MHDLRDYTRQTFTPALEAAANRLRQVHPSLRFSVIGIDVGSRTSYQGFNLYLECFWPTPLDRKPDSVLLEIQLCHLTTTPRINADICWEDGFIEAEFGTWLSSDEWPEATAEQFLQVQKALPSLLMAFENAANRGTKADEKRGEASE